MHTYCLLTRSTGKWSSTRLLIRQRINFSHNPSHPCIQVCTSTVATTTYRVLAQSADWLSIWRSSDCINYMYQIVWDVHTICLQRSKGKQHEQTQLGQLLSDTNFLKLSLNKPTFALQVTYVSAPHSWVQIRKPPAVNTTHPIAPV